MKQSIPLLKLMTKAEKCTSRNDAKRILAEASVYTTIKFKHSK